MILPALLLLLLAGAGDPPRARLHALPAEAEIGQPVEWVLEVEAPAGTQFLLAEQDPPLDASWVVLDARRVERGEGDGRARLRARWTLASLEAGERAPAVAPVTLETPAGRVVLQAESEPLRVRAALAEGEDAPRPQRGFLPAPDEARSRFGLALLAVLLAAALAFWLWRRRRARAQAPVALPGALERLGTLQQRWIEDPGEPREVVFALSRLVRERADDWLCVERASWTDEDWLRALQRDARVAADVQAAAARLLERAGTVKYALETPTRFALDELFADARLVLERLQAAGAPPAEAAA